MRLAIYNFGLFREPADSPAQSGLPRSRARGFRRRRARAGLPRPRRLCGRGRSEELGAQVFPRFYVERGDGGAPSTLSLWADIESLMAFVYSGGHAEALRRAADWFAPKAWPPYVLWWVAEAHRPDWREAVARFERLHDRGPAPEAFDFKSPFDEQGRPTAVDREAVKRLAAAR